MERRSLNCICLILLLLSQLAGNAFGGGTLIDTNRTSVQTLYPKGMVNQCLKMTSSSSVGWGTCGGGGNGGTLRSIFFAGVNGITFDPSFIDGNGGLVTAIFDLSSINGGSATPGGSNTQFQFNNSGSLGGNGALTFTKASKTLAIASDAPLDINSTSISIADTNITLDGASTTFTQSSGDITLAPASTRDLRVTTTGTGGDFRVNVSALVSNGGGQAGIGIVNPVQKVHINGDTATPTLITFTVGSTTGVTAADGAYIGVGQTGNFLLTNRESTNLIINNNGSEAMRINSEKKIGVSNQTPSYTLDVNGSSGVVGRFFSTSVAPLLVQRGISSIGSAAIGILKSRGTIQSPSAVQNGDFGGAVFFYAQNGTGLNNYLGTAAIATKVDGAVSSGSIPQDILFRTGSPLVDRMAIKSSGLIGVGTTKPSSAFHINGDAATATFQQFTIGGTTGTNTSDGFRYGLDATGNVAFNQQEKLSTIFYNNGSETFRLTKDRLLGMGVVGPSGKMHINGDAATSTTMQHFTLGGTTGTASSDGTLIQLNSGGQFNINQQEKLPIIITVNGSEAARFTAGRRLGIGTASPTYMLDIASTGSFGGVRVAGDGAQALWLQRNAASTASPNAYFVKGRGSVASPAIPNNGDNLGLFIFSPFNGASSQQEPAVFGARLSGAVAANSMPTDIYFSAGTSTSNRPERLTIKSSGNVGIGKTNPRSLLEVNGTAQMTGFRLTTSPTTGYVLTSDAGGNGTWAAAGAGTGDVVGPSASVINGIALFSATTGKAIKYVGSVPLVTRHQQSLYIGNGAGASANGTTTANTAFGFGALTGGTSFTGDSNTAFGYESERLITTGSSNTAIGSQAGEGITTGSKNTALGLNALQTTNQFNLTGSDNTCIGQRSCFGLHSTANGNTALGSETTFGTTATAARNIVIGFRAGDGITTGANNIVMGYDIDAPSNTGSNRMTIGNLIYGNGMTATGTTVSSGKIGIKDPTPSYDFDVNGTVAAKSVRPGSYATKPCASLTESAIFYNDTSNYMCFCDGVTANGLQMHSPTTQCF